MAHLIRSSAVGSNRSQTPQDFPLNGIVFPKRLVQEGIIRAAKFPKLSSITDDNVIDVEKDVEAPEQGRKQSAGGLAPESQGPAQADTVLLILLARVVFAVFTFACLLLFSNIPKGACIYIVRHVGQEDYDLRQHSCRGFSGISTR